jgi:hypothetical protein
LDVQESALFLRDRLHKGLYRGRKDKGYAMEVVTIAEKLPPDELEDIRDNSGKAQSQQDKDKRLEAEDNPKKVLKPKEDQGYASVLPATGAKKQPQKPRDTPKESSKDGLEEGRKQLQETP